MREEFRVHTDHGSFLVTITDYLSGAEGLGGIVAFAVGLVVIYLVFGTPIVIWPILMKEFRSTFESDTPFWMLVGIQVAFMVFRTMVLASKEKSSFLWELILQGTVFTVAMELVQCVFFYQMLLGADPAILREAGIESMSFWGLAWQHITVTFDSLDMLLPTLYLGYTGAALPAALSCLVGEHLRS